MENKSFYNKDTLPNLTDTTSFPHLSNVGPYKIESKLTKGGMSYLYLATHPKSKELVVIKILSPKFITNREMVNRFLKEAEIISMTDHPNIVKLYDQGKWEKGLFIAMEFVQGISLRQFILQKSLSQKRALQIIQEVAYALLHLHTHGVIHRDLKPENILITESGNVKVIDFGIAQLHTEIIEDTKSKKVKIIGTPIYMSPEQKKNPDMVSFVSDIYSLGIIAYELVLGRLSHGTTHLSLLPKDLRPIIEMALKIDPETRYQDIVDVITDINSYLKSLETKKIDEPFGDAFEEFLKDKDVFFQTKKPSWPQVTIGFDKQKGIALTSFYLDFFKVFESNYLIILVEPFLEGPTTFITTAALKGIIHTLLSQFDSKNNKFQLSSFANALNKVTASTLKPNLFECILLLLNPDLEEMTLISYGDTAIFHYSERADKLRELKAFNEPIGKLGNSELLETTDSWHTKDMIFLPSKQVKNTKNFPSLINNHLLLSPQNQTEKILEEVYEKNPKTYKRDYALLSLFKAF